MFKYLLSKKKLIDIANRYQKLATTQGAELVKLRQQVNEMRKKGYAAAIHAYDQLLKRCSYTKEAEKQREEISALMEYFR